jgi:hypothetical protein
MPDSGYAENQAETGLVRSTNFRPAVNKSSGRLSNQVIGAATTYQTSIVCAD